MKRILLPAALVLSLTSAAAFAQAPIVRQSPDTGAPTTQQPSTPPAGHQHHPHDPAKQAAHLAKELNLTPDQTSKLASAFADRDQKLMDLHANTALTPQDVHTQMKAIHRTSEQQLATILTPDQLQQMRAMHHGHGGPHQQGQPLTPPPTA